MRAPLVAVSDVSGGSGRLAWWVGDEGIKARVNIAQPEVNPGGPRERLVRVRSPLEPAMKDLGPPWEDVDPAQRIRLASRESISLLTGQPMDYTLFHGLTVFGHGLPVNVKDGGMKADWSVVLDRSMEGSPLVEHYLGARPDLATEPGHDEFRASNIVDEALFHLSDRIGQDAPTNSGNPFRPGPHAGILWNYARLWMGAESGRMRLVLPVPEPRVDLRERDWAPYNGSSRGAWRNDQQHANSTVVPVVSELRFSIRLRARREDRGEDEPGYALQLEIKPALALWNPYNVALEGEQYYMDTMIPPMIKVGISKPGELGETEEEESTSWLRLMWGFGGDGVLPTPSNTQGGKYFSLRTSANVDFEPGEVRFFSLANPTFINANSSIRTIELVPRWDSAGAYIVDLMRPTGTNTTSTENIWVPEGSTVWFDDVYIQDTHHPETQQQFPSLNDSATAMWMTLKLEPPRSATLMRYADIWSAGGVKRAAESNEVTMPERVIGSSANKNPVLVGNLVNGNHHVATWSFHARTTTQQQTPEQRTRGWIDGDPRALVGSTRWDGTRKNASEDRNGWDMVTAWIGESFNEPSYSDGAGGNRGLVAVGGRGNQAPQFDLSGGSERFRGFLGASNTPFSGFTHVPVFDVPRAPLVSVGQFQHAQLGRYTFEPGFVFGNSYANPRIPLNQTVVYNFDNITDFDLYDISYEVNQRIWDEVFFSTLAPDYVGGGDSFQDAFADRLDRLPNPRMIYLPAAEEKEEEISLDDLIASAGESGRRGAEALAARILVKGAFNVNSTSKIAWKVILTSMGSLEMPVVDPHTGSVTWEDPAGVRFPRFGHVLHKDPYEEGGPTEAPFFQGWRKISPAGVDALAEAIVEEVKARGPFRSMGDFVNRDPDASEVDHQRKGALQAALDKTVNQPGHAHGIGESLGDTAQRPLGDLYSDAADGESTTAGHAGFMLQGDLLQSLAPILQVRSDTFVIRTYGDHRTLEGSVAARAWCEAIVQRTSEYMDDTDENWMNPQDDTLTALNETFGRRFEIVAFRWLDASEVSN